VDTEPFRVALERQRAECVRQRELALAESTTSVPRIAAGGNSGLLYRVVEGAKTSWHIAPEFQLLDNTKWPTRDIRQLAGACYDLYAPWKDATKQVGEWNQARLVANGPHVEHYLNGALLLEYTVGSEDWNRRVAESKFKEKPEFAKATKGHICLQDHSDTIEFRNIKLRTLPIKTLSR